MKYTYQIDNINELKDTVGVVYIPEDESLLAQYKQIGVSDFSRETVDREIIEQAPIELWALELEKRNKKTAVNSIKVGDRKEVDESETIQSRVDKMDKIPLVDIAEQLKVHIKDEISAILEEYKLKYSPEEVALWGKLLAQAELVGSGEPIEEEQVRLLTQIAQAKNTSVNEMARKIKSKNAEYEANREALVVELKRKESLIDKLLSDNEAKKIGRKDVIDQFDKIPFFQPVDQDIN